MELQLEVDEDCPCGYEIDGMPLEDESLCDCLCHQMV